MKYHLRKVYTKLDITSRQELSVALPGEAGAAIPGDQMGFSADRASQTIVTGFNRPFKELTIEGLRASLRTRAATAAEFGE